MTEPGITRIFNFIAGAWPTTTITRETIHAWRLKLDRYDDDRVMKAIFDLAETEQWLPALSQIHQRCIELGRDAAMQLDTHTRRPLTPFGEDHTNPHDHEWNNLPEVEQAYWLDKALAEWPPLPGVQHGSVIIRAHAAYLARTTRRDRKAIA